MMWASYAFHIVLVVGVFTLLGPPIGYFTLLIPTLVMEAFTGPYPEPSFNGIVGGLFIFLLASVFSYFFGTIPAASVGLAVAIGQLLIRRFGPIHALATGLVVLLVFWWKPDMWMATIPSAQQVSGFGPGNSSPRPFGFREALLALKMLAVWFVPTLVCWFLVRNAAPHSSLD